jgi:hypothetical protein
MAIDQAFKDIRTIIKRSARTELKRQEGLERSRIRERYTEKGRRS